jgi:transposase
MRQPIYVRDLSQDERALLEEGLRSSDAFTVRRCQIVLSSAEGQRSSQIAKQLHCNDQTIRNAIRDFHAKGLAALRPGSSRPHRINYKIDKKQVEQLKEMLHQSPRDYGKPTSIWTLSLAADVAYEQQILKQAVSRETVRQALKRMGVNWKRAKKWITSPDPAYELKKSNETASSG